MVLPHQPPDVPATLTAITHQLQLLQRRLLRVDGLTTWEYHLLLGTVADTLVTVQRLNDQLARWRELDDTPSRENTGRF